MTEQKLQRWIPIFASSVIVLLGLAIQYGMTKQAINDLEARMDRHITSEAAHVNSMVSRTEWNRQETQLYNNIDEVKIDIREFAETIAKA